MALLQTIGTAKLLLLVDSPNTLYTMTYHALEETRRPRLQHLRNAEPHRRLRVGLRIVPLEHPDALAEPGDELEIISRACHKNNQLLPTSRVRSSTSDERLCGVHVRGNQARDDDPPCEIGLLFLRVVCFEGLRLADGGEEVRAHEEGAIEDDFAGRVEGYNGGVCVQHACVFDGVFLIDVLIRSSF